MKQEAKKVAFDVELKEGIKFGEQAILLAYRGSISHGTYRSPTEPNSIDDVDTLGVCVMPLEYYFGLKRFNKAKHVDVGKWDMAFYGIKHYINLLLKQNPNVLSLLYLRPQHYIYTTDLGQRIINNREIFLSKCAYKSFCGYANGQLKRLEKSVFNGRMGAKRKKLVEKYGFDCKNASTLIMVLRQGIELLLSGELTVYRPDYKELLEIKDGKWSLEKVKSTAADLFKESKVALLQSPLPENPDYQKANKLLIKIISDYHKEHHNL